jgi:hypothetical protein
MYNIIYMVKTSKPKVKNKENYDYMKTIKNKINNIIRDNNSIKIINNLTIKTNKIIIYAYQFIKLYCIYLFDNNHDIPKIDKEFICDVFKVITIRKCGSGGYSVEKMPQQLKDLTEFYKEHYSKLLGDSELLYYDKMSYILAYEAIDMETNIENIIREYFLQHLNKYVNIEFKLKENMDNITKENKDKAIRLQKKKEFYAEIKKIKDDLLSLNELKSNEKYHKWIKITKENIFTKNTFDKDNIIYDIKSNPQDYIKGLIYIGKQIEKYYDNEDQNNHKLRLFNVLPLRTNIIPKNITIDTAGFIQNFLGEESTTEHLKNYKKNNNQYNLWNRVFKLNSRTFNKNNYNFNYMIKTDGISVSILFIRLGKDNKPLKKSNRNNRETENIEYIEKVEFTDDMMKKKVVAIDLNFSDLIYCGSKDENNNLQTFRYTQNQRRLEIRTKKYSKIMDSISKEQSVNNQTIKEIETILSNYNSSTNNFEKFKKYIIQKNKINNLLFKHYEKEIYRKLKLNRYINTQKSESKMISNFGNKFGNSKDVIITLGDFDKCDNMKGVEPVICRKFRKIFKNAGYQTYLINEFRTSKLCNCCHQEIAPFLERKSHKPKDIKNGKNIVCHGLLCHKDIKPSCEIIHNRDKNAVQNMLYIVEHIKKYKTRPTEFSRTIKSFPLHDEI